MIVIAVPQMGGGLFHRYMKGKYVSSLGRAGAKVHWLDISDPDRAVKEALECDGLLLPGGADVQPQLYGQTPTDKCGRPNIPRDMVEMKLLEAFLPTNKPILCICRGIQILNVFFGGTLHQDIRYIQGRRHQRFRARREGSHQVKLVPHSNLGKLMGQEWITVNSMHHQAIDKLGLGLSACGISEDGFIEGAEVFLHPFCIGVQWHPEHMSKNDPIQQKLFEAFVSACK